MPRFGHFRAPAAFGACLLLMAGGDASGQGSLVGVTMNTGGGSAFSSSSVAVPGRPSSLARYLEMIIALTTDERVLPQVIPDSITVNIMDLSGLQTAVVVTADIAGFAWRPVTPGTIPLSSDAIVASLVAFPALGTIRETSTAYRVQVELPTAFYGQDIQVVVDLFDNLSPQGTTAFVGGVVLVPEPSSVALLGLGGLGLCAFLFRRRS